MQLQVWVWMVVLVTTVGVAVDASQLGARRGALGGGFLDMGPAGWFFACLLLWIIALPCYLAVRPRLVRQGRLRQDVYAGYPLPGAPAGPMMPVPTSVPMPVPMAVPMPAAAQPTNPGWYLSPSGFGVRWWDGVRWTEHHRS